MTSRHGARASAWGEAIDDLGSLLASELMQQNGDRYEVSNEVL